MPGSSPRVRGSLGAYDLTSDILGIIPAGAGLTYSHSLYHITIWDHPRGCGAHMASSSSSLGYSGSSPRVRGSLDDGYKAGRASGIIPAGAGLTQQCAAVRAIDWDHPRGCGAHAAMVRLMRTSKGSSPRVRGSLFFSFASRHFSGIIPAGAGLTCNPLAVNRRYRDHPRGCGAHTKKSQQLRHSLLLWLLESFTFKYSYRISHLVYSFVAAAT